jgi:hypothetical protein
MSRHHDGLIITTVSALVLALIIWSVTIGEKWSIIGEIVTPHSTHLDVYEWSYHWRIFSAVNVALAILGIVSGLFLMRRKRLGYAILAAVAGAKITYEIVIATVGFARYPFESPINISSAFFLALIAWALYRYTRSREHVARDT